WMALKEGGKAFYTTPLKALSNQKFGDLVALHGAGEVGLLTGDNSINPEAPIVVMTTEVLRNMIYERSALLDDLRYVILDEVHYLQDRYRGAVWEEVIIHLPVDVKIVSLSATVSNAEEFADWIQTLRGPTTAIIEEARPVKLEQHYLVDSEIYPMFISTGDEQIPNPEIRRLESRSNRPRSRRGRHPSHQYTRKLARRTDVVDLLSAGHMLPAIYFIFSRKGCNGAVSQCVREGIDLVDQDERKRIGDYADARCSYLAQEDLAVLGYDEWLRALKSGIAAHHAGLIPAFKETVEELFQAGLVKVVFATETLSLGINMPAKSVVIESLFKFTGERHEVLTPGEYTQLTGRAGRRGIDVLGHSVVPQQRDATFQQIAGLASTRTYPLISSFQPSYNMATNLIRNYSRHEADHLLNSSFAQYRADKDVVVLERLIERNEGYLASYREKMHCDRGEFSAYWELREQVTALEKSISRWAMTAGKEQTKSVLDLARPGQVLMVTTGKMRGPVAVVGHERSRRGDPRVLALTRNGRLVRLSASDFPRAPRVVGSLQEMKGRSGLNSFNSAKSIDHDTKRKLVHALEGLVLPDDAYDPTPLPEEEQGSGLDITKQKLLQHPCHSCEDRDKHAQWAERAARLEKENDGLIKRVRRRTETLSRRFERVLGILEEYAYVDGFNLTEKGWLLARIYNENDLLVAEALAKGWLAGLKPAELAAVASTFVFESRGPIEVVGTLPTQDSKKVFGKVVRLTERIKRAESRAGLEMTRGPESGFADVVYRWCQGSALEDVIDDDSTPGDFIRGCKQTIDLLKQMSQAAGSSELRQALDDAVDGVNRGVVAYTGVL
ncbi:MAG TPA: DEAD/DEAH box helicase, partial [Actinomycetota bacterium]|nr:DEAD/DEAH box helicase [Actinomycetota bacterium]